MPSFLSHARVQGPLAIARRRMSNVWRAVFAAAGRYRPFTADETSTAPGPVARFEGDIPRQIKPPVREQRRRVFARARPDYEEIEDLVYTPGGGAWKDGVIYERYSAGRPGLRMILNKPRVELTTRVARGVVVQSINPATYGDWVADYLTALARQGELPGPLFLPAAFADKPYVARDLKRLNVPYEIVDKPVRIARATALLQKKFYVHFMADDVASLRKFAAGDVAAPAPGSILYLSRCGERSEIADRSYPSLVIEAQVAQRGGRVLRAGQATLKDYQAAAAVAETVIFDHGSAAYNMVFWRPKRMIEIISDDWWNNAFLMFADADGVTDYTIIRGDDEAALADKLSAALDRAIKT